MNTHNGANEQNTLIPLTDNDGVQAVMGRELHKFLEVNARYNDWFPRMVAYGFSEGQDFYSKMSESTGGRPRTDHIVSLDMAKEISMIQRTEKGKQARAYFLECEKRAKQPAVDAASITRLELIQIAMNAETERLALEAKNKELEPKADAYDSFLDATGKYSVGAVAQMLGMGQNKLFRELRNRKIFISAGARRNTPYQHYLHHFEVLPHEYEKKNGEMGCSYTTYVQPSGIDFIRTKLDLSRIDPMIPAVEGDAA